MMNPVQMKYLMGYGIDTHKVHMVREMLKKGMSFLEIEEKTGIKYSVVMAIRHGKELRGI